MISPLPAIAYARAAVGAAYVYGAFGHPCTPDNRRARAAQYPGSADNIRKYCQVLSGRRPACSGCAWEGRRAYDCAQLSRLALRAAGVSLPSGASSQWRAKAWAFQSDAVFLAVSSPCLVFRRDRWNNARPMAHVGFALGDGFVVDARSHRDGVLLSRLSAYPWTHVAVPLGFPLPGHENPWDGAGFPGLLPAFGSRGEAVLRLQRGLLSRGFALPRYGADGIYGRETEAALRAFLSKRPPR